MNASSYTTHEVLIWEIMKRMICNAEFTYFIIPETIIKMNVLVNFLIKKVLYLFILYVYAISLISFN